MKIYIMSGACYSADGNLMSYARAFKDLESAEAALKEDFEKCTRGDVGTKYEWIDEQADISEYGMMWWSHGPNQTHCEIIQSEIE